MAGVLLRLLFILIPGNTIQPAWSGGGDVTAYTTLAENLLRGRGFTYAGQPTALRPPLYPIVLAGCMSVSSHHWPVVLRVLQFLLGLATVLVGAKVAEKLWGRPAKRAAALLLLYCPTLVYSTSVVAPEALATLLIALVLYFATENLGMQRRPVLAGASLGFATMVKEIAPVLGVIFLILYLRRSSLKQLVTFAIACVVVLSPWVLRNYVTLRTPVLSTLGDYALVDGLTNPQGRSQQGGDERTLRTLGWNIQVYERNDRGKIYSAEPEMDAVARATWIALVRQHPSWPLRLLPAKLSWFWLSADILFYGKGFMPGIELGRAAMVFVWWIYLVCALAALRRLWRCEEKSTFWLFLGWFALITAAHLPFGMNTRLRIPLADLPVAVLGASWAAETKLMRRFLDCEPVVR